MKRDELAEKIFLVDLGRIQPRPLEPAASFLERLRDTANGAYAIADIFLSAQDKQQAKIARKAGAAPGSQD